MNLADYGGIEKTKNGRIVTYLCDATKKLTLNNSADEISIKMIIHEAEVSKQTFYNHFPDKYAIFNYIFYRDFEKIIPNKSIKEIITISFPQIFNNDVTYYRAIASASAYNSFHNFLFTYIMKMFEKHLTKNVVSTSIPMDIRFAMELYAETTCNCFMSYLRNSPEAVKFTLPELGKYLYESRPAPLLHAFDT